LSKLTPYGMVYIAGKVAAPDGVDKVQTIKLCRRIFHCVAQLIGREEKVERAKKFQVNSPF
jgi:hypothetical protein